MTKKELLRDRVEESILDLMYYLRKHDEELSVSDVEELISTGEVSIDEITQWCKEEIIKFLN